jgi:hypothetical protein
MIEVLGACPVCEQDIEAGERCEVCAAEQLFAEFLAAMPEIGFCLRLGFTDEAKIIDDCYGGDARAYFLQSWENFLMSKC